MMKKVICLIFTLVLLAASGCGKKTVDQSAIYEKINQLAGDFSSDYISYEVMLQATDKNITLHNKGTITLDNGIYTYTYAHDSLNKIGSGADSLISTDTGSLSGTKDEILSKGFGMADGSKVFALNLKDSFKTYKIVKENDSYVMSGYIARNTIIKYTDNLDDDIRFNYQLYVNNDATEIEKLVISYVTMNFDSVVITIIFKEA